MSWLRRLVRKPAAWTEPKQPSDLLPDFEKRRLKREYGELIDQVSAILFKADLMGINYEENTDEYDLEAYTVVSKLPGMHSSGDVAAMVRGEFAAWFAEDLAGPVSRYVDVAAEIWIAWLARPRIHRPS